MPIKKEWAEDAVKRCRELLTQMNVTEEPIDGIGLHLAVFIEPFLEYVLAGNKTIESRFSVNRCAPYQRVHSGDVVMLKRQSGPVVGIARICNIWEYDITPGSLSEIRTKFSKGLCADDPAFWASRQHAQYATLMRLDQVHRVRPFECPKQDRRGWVVLSEREGRLFNEKE